MHATDSKTDKAPNLSRRAETAAAVCTSNGWEQIAMACSSMQQGVDTTPLHKFAAAVFRVLGSFSSIQLASKLHICKSMTPAMQQDSNSCGSLSFPHVMSTCTNSGCTITSYRQMAQVYCSLCDIATASSTCIHSG